MKPLVLTLKGFGIFSDRTTVDFTEAELFALTGPTGSGKTTILDGICFALYGAVPRHGDGTVAPIVNQQKNEATVGLTFSLHEMTYALARRVVRTEKGRASTNEATLERGETVLATGAGPVTAEIEKLLGLDFHQFTTCVLVPQGDFARFLHEQPRHRQQLLSSILDLGLYDIVANLASGRAKEAEGRLAVHAARLVELARITEIDLESLQTRKKELEALDTRLTRAFIEIDVLRQDVARLVGMHDTAQSSQAKLGAIVPPPGWKELSEEAAALATAETDARTEFDAAASDHAELAGVRLAARSDLERFLTAHRELVALGDQRTELDRMLPQAGAAATRAQEAYEAEVTADHAAHLRLGLKIGDPCPVCGGPVEELSPSAKEEARSKAITKARKAVDAAGKALRALETGLSQLDTRQGMLTDELEGVAAVDVLEAQLRESIAYEQALATARTRLANAQGRSEQLRQAREALGRKSSRLQTKLVETHAALAGLEPPWIDPGQPAVAWERLLGWRDHRLPEIAEQVAQAALGAEEGRRRLEVATGGIVDELTAANLPPEVDRARATTAAAIAEIGGEIKRVEAARDETDRVNGERDAVATRRDVAKKLSAELGARGFKKWIFDEVFAALVAGANRRLTALTSGQYELCLENNEFAVIDHFAADHKRGVKSLSGGETFLVSLALAVALADEVAAAAGHRVALDSLFLDEGFGTLDNESLEVVSAVIADLGAGGKTVGIVTHIEELAAQMPVRYEVRRLGNSATVTQVGE